MNALELKVPPPVVALCLAMLMWLTTRVIGPIEVPQMLRLGAALTFACVGLGLELAGVISFVQAKTTVNPLKPARASSLVSTGIYRVTRNPMYLGLLLMLLGWATFLANGLAYLPAPLFVLYINRFQIGPEERMLLQKFGAGFSAYKARVRRWL
ncbi:MAG: methyltransferase family protein [Burkholderiales bacterium]